MPENVPHAPLDAETAADLISGRKAFQRPMSEAVELRNAIQDVYLEDAVTIA